MKLRNTASGIMPRKGDPELYPYAKDLAAVLAPLMPQLKATALAVLATLGLTTTTGCVEGDGTDVPVVGHVDGQATGNTPSAPREELGVATLNLLDEAVALTATGTVVTDTSTTSAHQTVGSDAAIALMQDRTPGEVTLEAVEDGTVRRNTEGAINNCGTVIATVDTTPAEGPIDDLLNIANGGNETNEIGITACVAVDKLKAGVHTLVFRATSDGRIYFEVALDKDTNRPTDLVGEFNVATGDCTVTSARFGEEKTVTPSRPACKDAVEHIGRSVGANFGN
ncbi:hypothetical protein COV81_05965 [Candidatus Peregrinibacteria bacterium CG11_big_fil_rev_8_21_14_0_20_41_10]|nr:MAG: hypothetical protein COV81_05965 [Candidatus Peregrinibacteria bacterium CG11_big_fil_rev_8_21_14_0_20_41_10]